MYDDNSIIEFITTHRRYLQTRCIPNIFNLFNSNLTKIQPAHLPSTGTRAGMSVERRLNAMVSLIQYHTDSIQRSSRLATGSKRLSTEQSYSVY